MKTGARPERFWEIDFVRGIAIVLMIILHFWDDLFFLKMIQGLNWPRWFFWQRITASLFLLLVGVSLTLMRFRAERSDPGNPGGIFRNYVKRGGVIFGSGLLISLITKIYLGEGFVVFGILHLIGSASILCYPLLKLKWWNFLVGAITVCFGIYLSSVHVTFPWLLWAGLIPADFGSVDFFPVFPWLGMVLFGLALGNILYSQNGRKYNIYDCSKNSFVKYLSCIGKNSLVIYLVHQPVFILLLSVLKLLGKEFFK